MKISKKVKLKIKEYLRYTDEDIADLRKTMNELSDKYYNFQLELVDPEDKILAGGIGNAQKDGMIIRIAADSLYKESLFLSILFHEIGHLHCYKNDMFATYHYGKDYESVLRSAYRAEKWIDNWAKKEMKKMFPSLRFIGSYITKSPREIKNIKKFLKEYLQDYFGMK